MALTMNETCVVCLTMYETHVVGLTMDETYVIGLTMDETRVIGLTLLGWLLYFVPIVFYPTFLPYFLESSLKVYKR